MELIVRESQDATFCRYTEKRYSYDELDNLPRDLLPSLEQILFITGNENKVAELNENLPSSTRIQLKSMKIDLPEIQHSDPLAIVQDKCLRARDQVSKLPSATQAAVLIEDTCLNFQALGGLPGPYVKCR